MNFIRISVLCSSIFLVAVPVRAEITSYPPATSYKAQRQALQKKTQIDKLLKQAKLALKERRLNKPSNNSAVFYADQLLQIPSGDSGAYVILREVVNSYISLAETKLEQNNTETAQDYYNEGHKTALRYKLTRSRMQLGPLQEQILAKRIMQSKQDAIAVHLALQQKQKTEVVQPSSTALERQAVAAMPMQLPILLAALANPAPINSQKPLASTLYSDPFVVMVNKDNPISTITTRKLKLYYKLRRKSWDNGERITLILPHRDSDALRWLMQEVFHVTDPVEVSRFYLQAVFKQQSSELPKELKNPISNIEAIPGAIAIVKPSEIEISDSVKIITIEGL